MRAASSDSERFQAWLEHSFEAQQRSAETISMGPFRAVIHRDWDPPSAWVTLVEAGEGDDDARQALAKLRAAFSKHRFDLEVEYDDHAFPQARKWFEEAGLSLEEVVPLMACRPDTFRQRLEPEVSLTRLSVHTKVAELEAFQRIRWTDGGDDHREPPDSDSLLQDLERSPASVYLLAWVEWEPVGTGISHLTRDAAEVVGVVTRNDRRRRGVAATVTSDLVSRHFSAGGDFAFLEAANEPAVRVYERLGFSRFGTKALYR